MPTNIKLLPLLRVDFEIADNEDWIDSLPVFVAAGDADGYRSPSNVGSAQIGPVLAAPTASVGNHIVTITAIDSAGARFRVTDDAGSVEGLGIVGLPAEIGGLSFTITPGDIASVAGDNFSIAVLPSPIDISGITFSMFVKETAVSATIFGQSSTENGEIVNGGPTGSVAIIVPRSSKQYQPGSFVVDILAKADGLVKRIVGQVGSLPSTLTVYPGVTPAS